LKIFVNIYFILFIYKRLENALLFAFIKVRDFQIVEIFVQKKCLKRLRGFHFFDNVAK